MITERAMKYWHWWIITFAALTFLCCFVSCLGGALTANTDTVRTDTIAEAEYPGAAMLGAWWGVSFWWWVAGMGAVTLLTIVVIVLTLFLGKSH